MRKDIYSMMTFWLDKGVDGFRMDVCNLYSKDIDMSDIAENGAEGLYINGPKIHDYFKEMNEEVFSKYDIMTVGETPGVSPEHARAYVGEGRIMSLICYSILSLWIYRIKVTNSIKSHTS